MTIIGFLGYLFQFFKLMNLCMSKQHVIGTYHHSAFYVYRYIDRWFGQMFCIEALVKRRFELCINNLTTNGS